MSFGMPCNEYDYISQIASFEDFETLDGIPADIIANHGMAENWEEDHGTEQECE